MLDDRIIGQGRRARNVEELVFLGEIIHNSRRRTEMPRIIAALDDEPDLIELLRVNMTRSGFSFEGFTEVEDFFRYLERGVPDLVILDLMLPGMDGFDVFRTMRKMERTASVPVIMLTARAEESERVLGLELGADDYVAKPFSVRELTARVHAVLRRVEERSAPRRIEIDGLIIDPESHEVTAGGKVIELTVTEFKIIELLASRPGRVFSRGQILDRLWGDEKIVVDRTIDVHMHSLRDKLGPAGDALVSVRGVGYKIKERGSR